MSRSVSYVFGLLLLSGCSTPPKPPTVDESHKRPANAAAEVDLQICKSELQNVRIVVRETTRLAETASANATRLALLQQATPTPQPPPDMTNLVHTVHFAFGSVELNVPEATAAALIEQAKAAALIALRGRTDGEIDSPAESRVARERALAVRTWLVQSGVDPARIRTTWQPVGDPIASYATADGRALNRRVEIELYRSLPRVAALTTASPM